MTTKFGESILIKNLLVLTLLIGCSCEAVASQCPPSTLLEKWSKVTIVFAAKVIRTEEIKNCRIRNGRSICSSSSYEIHIEPIASYVGDASALTSILTPDPGIHLGVRVEDRKKYVFFGYENEMGVWVRSCLEPLEIGTDREKQFWKKLNAELQEQTLESLNGELPQQGEQ